MDFLPTDRLGQARVEHIDAADGTPLAVRVYGESGSRTPVVLLHGLASHAGWFVQSQTFLAHLGCPVYAMDRRGSGASGGDRGECTDYRQMGEDVNAVVTEICRRHKCDRVQVLGHCFGTIPAALFAVDHPTKVASLIMASSGIYTHLSVSLRQKLRIVWSRAAQQKTVLEIPLRPAMFSELEECIAFIREDESRLKTATASFYWQVLQARKHIRAQRHRLFMPIFMANAGADKICNNAANERFFQTLPAEHKLLVTYPKSRHVIEFSRQRDDFFRDVDWWLERWGGDGYARDQTR